jgi:hypothetical protein
MASSVTEEPFFVLMGESDRNVSGRDTVIATLDHDALYATINGTDTLLVTRFSRLIQAMAEMRAGEAVGEVLHHGDFFITTDAERVRELGMLHDCEDCRAGVDRALASLAEHPGADVVIGQLYWAGK